VVMRGHISTIKYYQSTEGYTNYQLCHIQCHDPRYLWKRHNIPSSRGQRKTKVWLDSREKRKRYMQGLLARKCDNIGHPRIEHAT
jgi:hypothetical protein